MTKPKTKPKVATRSASRKTAKPASRKRSAPASSRPAAGPGTKHARIIAMLRTPAGATIASLVMLPNYHTKRDDLAAIAEYIARKREAVDETESRAARILHGLIRNERLG